MSANNRTSRTSYTGSRSQGRNSQSTRSGRNVRPSTSQRARRNKKKKRRTPNYRLAAILGVVLILVITAAVLWAKQSKKAEPVLEPSTEETQLDKDVTVDGITITGLSRNEAKQKLLKQYTWGMKVTCEGEDAPYEVPNLMENKINALLDEIFTGTPKESYTLDTKGLEDAVTKTVSDIAAKWDMKPQNSAITGFDKDSGNFIYSKEKAGHAINQDQLKADMNRALASKDFKAVLTATVSTVKPEITEDQAKALYQVIGTMSTTTTTNKARNTNIQLAVEALDGMIIQPGEEFSFNTTTGNRTLEKGYRPAGAYVNGVLVEEPGGGVCQVSSTLYNAVVFSGLTTTERNAHSYEPTYITPGEDAMVSYDGYAGPDMKFVNNTKDAVAIRAKFENQKLTISIVGIQILDEGEKLYMKSEKVAQLDPPEPVYEENQTLEPGVEKVVKEPVPGSRWSTNLVVEKDGVVVSDEFFHKSTYRGKAAVIQRNTSGVVIPPPTEAAVETIPEQNTADTPTEGTPLETSASPEGPAGPSADPSTGPPPVTRPVGPSVPDQIQPNVGSGTPGETVRPPDLDSSGPGSAPGSSGSQSVQSPMALPPGGDSLKGPIGGGPG